MQEAKASWNGYYRSASGNKDQFTLRQEDEQADKDFVLRVRQFEKTLAENGWKPWSIEETQKPPVAVATAKPAAPAPSAPPPGDGKTFPVESIKLAAGGDHPRWVVKGGKFKKFGVTCWPETLESAGIAKKLDPLKDNKPEGNWVAHYAERENEEGKLVPDKVTSLVRQQ